MIRVNGEAMDMAGKTLLELLSEKGYDLGRIAVERNGEIVQKASYGQIVLADGDEIEIVSFVGGG